jgi:hypothetical protein
MRQLFPRYIVWFLLGVLFVVWADAGPLHEAINQNDIVKVKQLIAQGADGPTGLNLRSHVICSICLSKKELYQRCQVCMMAESTRAICL